MTAARAYSVTLHKKGASKLPAPWVAVRRIVARFSPGDRAELITIAGVTPGYRQLSHYLRTLVTAVASLLDGLVSTAEVTVAVQLILLDLSAGAIKAKAGATASPAGKSI